ncbi:hypothetical protein UlMin_032153 [Ulmus minor]
MSGEYIRPPDMNNVHHTIRYNNRLFPYFQGCVGAIDGTHVSACVGGARADKFRGRKGDTTWNVLAACDFDLKFTYMLSGWEGSAHDARVLEHAISEPQNGFPFPPPDHVSGDEDDDDASSEDDSVDADPDGVDVGESSSHLNIPQDMDMGAFRDYVTKLHS